MQHPKVILITGATSGLGAALAEAYARPGICLALTGRNAERLKAVADICQTKGAEVLTAIMDVCDRAVIAEWIQSIDQKHSIDLAIANAGVSAGSAGGGEEEEQTRTIFEINVGGVMNTIFPLIPLMSRRGRGQIAIISSLAGFRGLPGVPAYSASKAAVRVWGEALRGDLYRKGISVSVICPGYVVTPMTDRNDFKMPFLMTAERAAQIMQRGLGKGRARIAFPWPTYVAVWLLMTLPSFLTDAIVRRLPKKKAGI